MSPLSDQIPKALLPIDGRPVIDQILERLAAAGIHEVTIVTGHLEEKLKAYLGLVGIDERLTVRFAHHQSPQRSPALSTLAALEAGHPPVRSMISVADSLWPLGLVEK